MAMISIEDRFINPKYVQMIRMGLVDNEYTVSVVMASGHGTRFCFKTKDEAQWLIERIAEEIEKMG